MLLLSPSGPHGAPDRVRHFARCGLEMRKSLSTRSGKAVAVAGSCWRRWVADRGWHGERRSPARSPLGVTGMLTALVLVSLGVLSTAGEWSNGSIQTTFLLEPRRGRVMAAKAAAVAPWAR